MSEILIKFSSVMNLDRPKNLLLLDSFPNPDLENDGVHLTPYSGYEYVSFLFENVNKMIRNLSLSPEAFVVAHSEAIRSLEDRVVVLERDHRRLNKTVEYKTAVDAEAADFADNRRYEDQFIISGLTKVRAGLTTKEWQTQAKQDVAIAVTLLLNRDITSEAIKVVHNQTGTRKSTTNLVQMFDLSLACEIRAKFGACFAGGKDARPIGLRTVSVGNWVTPATKVRIAILKVMAENYRSKNPGSRVQVVGYESRPLIRISPPSDSNDRRTKVFNFIEAVKSLPTSFKPDQISSIMSKVNPKLYSSLRALFIILDDDMPKVHRSGRSDRPDQTPVDTGTSASASPSDPPPVPPPVASPDRPSSGRGSSKRAPTSPARHVTKSFRSSN